MNVPQLLDIISRYLTRDYNRNSPFNKRQFTKFVGWNFNEHKKALLDTTINSFKDNNNFGHSFCERARPKILDMERLCLSMLVFLFVCLSVCLFVGLTPLLSFSLSFYINYSMSHFISLFPTSQFLPLSIWTY